jgi:hypothetical protein
MSIHRLTKPAIAGVLSALAMAPAAFAGQTPRSDLNPPPPDFYSCSASGDQTICRAHLFEREDPVQTDVQCPGFPIYDQGDVEERLTRWYDADGNFVKRQIRGMWTNAMWSNPLTGDTVPYTQSGIATDVLGTPGDVDTITETETGENVYTDPVTHKKVLRSVGRTVFGPDGTLLAESGQQWAIDLFVFGDESVLDGVCAALAR